MKTMIEQIFPDMEMKVQEAPLSGEDKAVLQQKLFPLLERQFRLKTQGDRTSLREEEAAEFVELTVDAEGDVWSGGRVCSVVRGELDWL